MCILPHLMFKHIERKTNKYTNYSKQEGIKATSKIPMIILYLAGNSYHLTEL